MTDVLVIDAEYDALSSPIERIFDTFRLPLAGKKILIKPNLVIGRPPQEAVNTHPEVVDAIAKECFRNGAKKIWVGDNAGGLPEWSIEAARDAGLIEKLDDWYTDISCEASAVDLGISSAPPLMVSKKVLEADIIINVPKLKTHPLVGYTACVKNMFGVVIGLDKARIHSLIRHPARLAEFLVVLYKKFCPHLNIVDGILAMDGEGPSHGNPKQVGKLIAGYNGALVDIVVASMMGINVDGKPYYKFIQDQGLISSASLSDISVEGSSERLKDFSLAKVNTLSNAELRLLLKTHGPLKPTLIEEKCIGCRKCHDICPQGAIAFDAIPAIDYKKCIACWCCYEMCPEGAWVLPDPHQVLSRIGDNQ